MEGGGGGGGRQGSPHPSGGRERDLRATVSVSTRGSAASLASSESYLLHFCPSCSH